MFFRSRQKEIENQIEQYCQEVTTCLHTLRDAMQQYVCKPDREALRASLQLMHKAESRADDLRGEIEVLMYSKAVFPESRKDILELLESMDKTPNCAESLVRMILTQRIVIPEEYVQRILQIVDVSVQGVEDMLDGVRRLFFDYTGATVDVGKVDQLESQVDRLEAALIEDLFGSSGDGFTKLLLRDLIQHLGKITDRAENVGNRIRILVAKRRI
jgi:predicted phosphate transport protein (TIGR00153 family)